MTATESAHLLAGKTALVSGVANRWSIATAIARAYRAHGASLVLTYEGERTKPEVDKLAQELGQSVVAQCDVSADQSIADLHGLLSESGMRLNALVHSIAFARKEELSGKYLATSRAGFALALDVSAYSLVALCRELAPLFSDAASVVALTYLGSVRAVPNYNIMGVAKAALESSVRYLAADLGQMGGVRVNAISAGPIKTASARAVGGFTSILSDVAAKSPLRRNAVADDVANAAVFLASDLSCAITGHVLYVDAGYNIMGIT
ncbi:MAG: SDR family oxidoreductase [Candidatus Eremiobacteraeota bacterium]|nr:SDR family oxidoreductase [Candidatus Eremiobacteraeota bacterium]MBC5827625.1 SDR family oxidoreductase [Candidatus Eremiobacteraeota bacterium]